MVAAEANNAELSVAETDGITVDEDEQDGSRTAVEPSPSWVAGRHVRSLILAAGSGTCAIMISTAVLGLWKVIDKLPGLVMDPKVLQIFAVTFLLTLIIVGSFSLVIVAFWALIKNFSDERRLTANTIRELSSGILNSPVSSRDPASRILSGGAND